MIMFFNVPIMKIHLLNFLEDESTCLSFSSFSITKELIWNTKPNMAIAKKKVGPIVAIAEKGSAGGCANSFKPTLQSKFGSKHMEDINEIDHQLNNTESGKDGIINCSK